MFLRKCYLTLIALLFISFPALDAAETRPNVVIIYADDLGFGDISCQGAKLIQTPNIDQLARSGRRFTDAHAASAVCTPSRFALFSGTYAWRSNLFAPIFLRSPLVLNAETYTLADLAKQAGLATALFGKWHLGFGEQEGIDWNQPLKPGPLELGFDHFFGIPVVNSHPPFVYVENHHVLGLDPADPILVERGARSPTESFVGKNVQPTAKDGWGVHGGTAAHALYRDEEVNTRLIDEAKRWLSKHAQQRFLLCITPTAIHHPATPSARFKGTSQCGDYGDFVHELDWMVGEIVKTLDQLDLREQTLVIFTSDNGGMLNDAGEIAWQLGHRLNGPHFGFKFDAWEGGHRVPFIVSWPNHVPENTVCDHLICSIDLMRTLARIWQVQVPSDAALDSFDITSEWFGTARAPVRDHLLVSGFLKTHVALRTAQHLYLPAKGGGGFGNGLRYIAKTKETTSDITPAGKIKPRAPEEQIFDVRETGVVPQNLVIHDAQLAHTLRTRYHELRKTERTAAP